MTDLHSRANLTHPYHIHPHPRPLTLTNPNNLPYRKFRRDRSTAVTSRPNPTDIANPTDREKYCRNKSSNDTGDLLPPISAMSTNHHINGIRNLDKIYRSTTKQQRHHNNAHRDPTNPPHRRQRTNAPGEAATRAGNLTT